MTDPTSDLICPKCEAPMRTYARNGITIEQCTVCHGIFLDRGELERLITAESSYLGQFPGEPRQAQKRSDVDRGRGFLGELFD